MSAPIYVIRHGSRLMPHSELDEEAIRALPTEFEIVPKLKRSSPQLRLYWALMETLAENLEQPVTKEAMSQWFKLRCGLTEEIKMRSGNIVTLPSSVAFDKLPQDQFSAYFDRVKELARSLGYSAGMERRVREMVG